MTYPNITQIKDYFTREAVKLIQGRVKVLEDTQLSPPVLAGDSADADDIISKGFADANYGAAVMATALAATGANPLSVSGLRGLLADAQRMGIRVISENTILPAADVSIPYEVVTWKGYLYYFDPAISNPGSWIVLSTAASVLVGTHATRPSSIATSLNTVYWESDRMHMFRVALVATVKVWVLMEGIGGPMRGTISPNQKPTDLGTDDAGFRFLSTDFNRTFIWTGLAWADAPEAPTRWQFGFFDQPPEPLAGWAVCDGNVTTRSTNTGTTTPYTPPDLITANSFLRAAAAAGGTGGALTHTHTGTTGGGTTSAPSSSVEVEDVGANPVRVADNSHTHTFSGDSFTTDAGSSLPPYYDGYIYIRV